MWTAAAMSREANCSYNQCFAFTLDGPLRVESLARRARSGRRAARRVARRHRSGRHRSDDPAAVLRRAAAHRPVGARSRGARAGVRDACSERECETPFDLAEGPLVRAFVVRESAERHRVRPHGASHRLRRLVVVRPLLGPRAALRGRPRRHPGPARPGRVVPALRRGADEPRPCRRGGGRRGVLGRAVSRRSAGPRPAPHRTRPATKTYRSGREDLRIDDELYAAIKQHRSDSPEPRSSRRCSRRSRCSCYRLSGQSDFVVGIPFAGQPQLENSALVAHCVNTVPLRARLDPDGPVRRAPSHGPRRACRGPGPLAHHLRQPGAPVERPPRPRAARRSCRSRSASTRSARRSISAT